MTSPSEPVVEYGVQVRYVENGEWHDRYGWFPEVPDDGDPRGGLERMRETKEKVEQAGALVSGYFDVRVIKRTTYKEVVQ